ISHSTKPDAPRDKEYLDTLAAALTPEFDVLLDRTRLKGGEEWPRELDGYMAECHAAVILLSRNALESAWVNKEVAILNWRRSLEPGFLLLPVVMEGVSPQEVREHRRFAAMELRRWQFVPQGSPAEVADRVLERCRSHAPRPNSTPLERLVVNLTGMLEDAKQAQLLAAARDLGIEVSEGKRRGHEEIANQLARRLASAGLEELHPLVRALAPVIGEAQTRRLIKYVKSLWVNAEAAGKIPPVAENLDQRRAIGLNGTKLYKFTADNYLDRAYRGDVIHQLIRVDGAIGQLAFEEIVATVQKYFTDKDYSSEEVEEHLKTCRSLYFVLLPPPVPDRDVLEKLQFRFPRLTFLLTTGKDTHDDPRVKTLPQLVTLNPPLTLENERKAWSLHEDLKVILDNLAR
ncbi:MAG TPA: toll/interleukin-1 receptor domain-containing protein, partial [Myxococcaceae bacterium]